MGITHFPNGISSFGSTIMGPSHLWLPQGASVYFVAKAADGGSTSGTGSYESPTSTIQRAVEQVTAGSTTANLQGSTIYVNPGRYNEQVVSADRRGFRLIGSGMGLTHLDLTGVSGTSSVTPTGQSAGAPAMVLASRNHVVTGFTFKVILNTYGLYIGDGRKYNSAYNYVAQDCHVYGNKFDGDAFAGYYGLVVDGAKSLRIYDNIFFNLGAGGIHGGSGVGPTSDVKVWFNHFKACRGYGVRIAGGASVHYWSTGPFNIFEDDVTTAMTNPAAYGAAGGPNSYCGNYEMCANEFSGQTTDFHGGNYEGLAGNTMTHVSQA